MKKTIIFLLIVSYLLTFCGQLLASENKNEILIFSDDRNANYLTGTDKIIVTPINDVSGNSFLINFWFIRKMNKEGSNEFIIECKKNGNFIETIKNISYIIYNYETLYRNNKPIKIKMVSNTFYDKNDKNIITNTPKKNEFQSIIPDTHGDKISTFVLDYCFKNNLIPKE